MGHRLEFGVLELGAWSLEFGVWSLEFLYGRGSLIPHADVSNSSKVGHHEYRKVF